MEIPFMSSGFRPEAAFASAAEQFFDLLKSFGVQPGTGAAAAPDATKLAGSLAGQFEQWLRATQSAGPWFSAGAGGGSGPAGIAAAFNPGAGNWPFGPLPLGMGAAAPPEGQRSWELITQLAQVQAQLATHWHEIATSAAGQFAARLGSIASGPPTMDGALKIYELWVDCAEAAYGATVRKDDFARLQSQLANISAALLVEQRKHAETLARAFGLPTRNEVDALYGQIKELRRQVAAVAAGRATARKAPQRQQAQRAKRKGAPRPAAGRRKRRT
jgi:Poly(R)-hydroxyalkanoic acid synthase subunit (PHA_synth_III_E)